MYENGGRHNTGIYRPTGICLMLKNSQTNPRDKTLNLYDFCLVCRYVSIHGVG